jgi:hypothetical protein
VVCGYPENDNATGAQTGRPGAVQAGELLAWRQGLTGRFPLPAPGPLSVIDPTQLARGRLRLCFFCASG